MAMIKIAIDKHLINDMELVTFPGQIHVVDSMLTVNAAVNVLRHAAIVGFDTETRPSFKKGVHHKLALIQLSTPDECFLFRVNKIGVPLKLAESCRPCLQEGGAVDTRRFQRLEPCE